MSARSPSIAEEESVELLASDGTGSSRQARVRFTTAELESYAFSGFQPLIYDAMVVAAAVEFGDRTVRRHPSGWRRDLRLRVPVHDLALWRSVPVASALCDAVTFLSGDTWTFDFVERQSRPVDRQGLLALDAKIKSVLLYSDGMDSRATAGLRDAAGPGSLVRVRVGKRSMTRPCASSGMPFAGIPFQLEFSRDNREVSARTRGFKFALVGGIAAHLARADEVILPESGQGIVGPVLVRVGHTPPDYRNHPLFTRRMERLLEALFGRKIRYEFPRLWSTKGETLREFIKIDPQGTWRSTRSCWQDARSSSVGGEFRQCGTCAACMLRRVSVHAAGQEEPSETYLSSDLDSPDFATSIDLRFSGRTSALYEYAIAGVLHMDHLAAMARPEAAASVRRHSILVARAMDMSGQDTEKRLIDMLANHAAEWRAFLKDRSPDSFVRRIAA